jgi:hypothetical protein
MGRHRSLPCLSGQESPWPPGSIIVGVFDDHPGASLLWQSAVEKSVVLCNVLVCPMLAGAPVSRGQLPRAYKARLRRVPRPKAGQLPKGACQLRRSRETIEGSLPIHHPDRCRWLSLPGASAAVVHALRSPLPPFAREAMDRIVFLTAAQQDSYRQLRLRTGTKRCQPWL